VSGPMVSVPVEPTEAMLKAAHAAILSDIPPDGESHYGPTISTHAIYRAYWAAMIAAAPAPQPVQGEAVGYVDGSRLHELREGRLNIALWNERGGNADTPLYTQPPAPAVVDGRIMDGDVRAIACALARLDGYDPSDENGGLYDLRWAGGPEPEPLGDAWNMDYMPKAKKIAAAIGYRSAPPIKPTPAAQIAAPGDPWPTTEADEAAMAQAADAGNPAWWRGHDEACTILCQKVNAILDGKDTGRGVANDPWESTRRRLLALVAAPGDVERRATPSEELCKQIDSTIAHFATPLVDDDGDTLQLLDLIAHALGDETIGRAQELIGELSYEIAALRSQGQADAVELRGVRDTLIVAANNPVSHGGIGGLRELMLTQAHRITAALAQ